MFYVGSLENIEITQKSFHEQKPEIDCSQIYSLMAAMHKDSHLHQVIYTQVMMYSLLISNIRIHYLT